MNYGLTSYESVGTVGSSTGMVAFMTIFYLAVIAFSVVVMWKIFKKAGKEGWIALIPFYNLYTLYEITWGNGWLFLLLFLVIVPFIGWIAVLVINILTMIKLAKVFGKGAGFAVGLIFLSLIFEAILAFDDSKYVGIEGQTASVSNTDLNNTVASQPVEPEQTTESSEVTEPVDETNNEQ